MQWRLSDAIKLEFIKPPNGFIITEQIFDFYRQDLEVTGWKYIIGYMDKFREEIPALK